jgi:hypothetical protein
MDRNRLKDLTASMDEVATSRPCIDCGYDLQGLDVDGVCPECSAAIARSLDDARLLRNASPEWFKAVQRGITIFLRGVTIVLLTPAILFLIALFYTLAGASFRGATEMVFTVLMFIGAVVMLGGAFSIIVGSWLVSRSTSGGLHPPAWARLGVRIGFFVAILASMAGDQVWSANLSGWAENIPRLVLTALWWWAFLGLSVILKHMEQRTEGWNALLEKKHRLVRRDQILMLILCGGGPAYVVLTALVGMQTLGSWSIAGLSLAAGVQLLLMHPTISRVQQAVVLESRVNSASPAGQTP